jgi:hypothetical protein
MGVEQMEDERVVGGTGERGQALKKRRRERNTPEVDTKRLMSGQAWADFCEALKSAGQHILGPDCPDSPLDRAEGFRYLMGLVTAGIRQAIDLSDPDIPCFFRNPDRTSKWGAENADNQYLWTKIRSDASYRITGKRGSAYEFLIEVKEGYMQLGDDRNFAALSSTDLEIGPNGSFEIILSAAQHQGNWLPLHPDARYVLIRQYFRDWENEEPAEFRIVQVGNEGGAPLPLQPARMAEFLDDAGEWIENTARFWNEWVRELRSQYRRNSIAPARLYVGGADDIRYGNDVYRLAEDEAMIIESELPGARYWAFQLCNLWFESLDYANRQTSINGHQAHQDPGVPNWLDTAGHLEGTIQYRWVWTKTNPSPKAQVVKFDEIRKELPGDTPFIGPEARREIIRKRQAHIARRELFG